MKIFERLRLLLAERKYQSTWRRKMSITKRLSALFIAIMLCSTFAVIAFPATAEAAILSVNLAGNGNGTPYLTYHPNANGVPAAFAQKNNLVNFFHIGGKAVYCIDIYNHVVEGGENYTSNSNPAKNLTTTQRNLLSVILTYGETTFGNNYERQIATQLAVWLVTTGLAYDDNAVNGVINGFAPNANIGNMTYDILNYARNFFKKPSFDGQTFLMYWDEDLQTYKTTLTDENGLLNNYNFPDKSTDDVTITQDGSTLTVTGSPSALTTFSCSLSTASKPRAGLLYLTRGNNQELTYRVGTLNDPIPTSFNVRIAGGSLKVEKDAQDGVLAGFKFKVTNATGFEQVITTGDDGTAQLDDLAQGEYTIEEIDVPGRYEAEVPITINVLDGGRLSVAEAYNALKSGKVKLQKWSANSQALLNAGIANKILAGGKYGIYRADNDELVSEIKPTISNGWVESDVFYYAGDGKFYVKEMQAPQGYKLDETKYEFTLSENEQVIEEKLSDETLIGKVTISYDGKRTGGGIVNTSDNKNLIVYSVLIAFAVIGMIFALIKRRKINAK